MKRVTCLSVPCDGERLRHVVSLQVSVWDIDSWTGQKLRTMLVSRSLTQGSTRVHVAGGFIAIACNQEQNILQVTYTTFPFGYQGHR